MSEKTHKQLEWTGERYVPQVMGDVALEHLHRYAFACEFSAGKRILDIACGEGYGAEMLAKNADSVVGVDVDAFTVAHARRKYKLPNLCFLEGRAEEIPLPDRSVDLVVSFETLEHFERHDQFMTEIGRVLDKNGLLVISSPEKSAYSDQPKYQNPFHRRELYREDFIRLIQRRFPHAVFLEQRIAYGSHLVCPGNGSGEFVSYRFDQLPSRIEKTPGLLQPVYLVAVCSASPLHAIPQTLCEQKVWESEGWMQKDAQVTELRQMVSQKDAQVTKLSLSMQTLEVKQQELSHFLEQLKEQASSPSLKCLPGLFYWPFLLWRIRKIPRPPWLILPREPRPAGRPGFWRRLERSIRKRRKWLQDRFGFDREWYLQEYPDVAASGVDPLDHYLAHGKSEGRFKNKKDILRIKKNFKKSHRVKSPHGFELRSWNGPPISRDPIRGLDSVITDIRAIALYLPQFHAIPENDEWWGKGFTEWTNVRRGVPQYENHYQPHVPHPDLGYYDLNDPAVMEKQAAMARAAGIEGFCFYYYWFKGRRLLNMPTDRLLATGKPDFPFCFCWANENWTRTWDGGDRHILMEQRHSPENDANLIHGLLPALRDRRYIRVGGKPILVVYRPGLLPAPAETAARWRKICRKEGIGEIHLAFMSGFDDFEPAEIGFDAAIQMPPLRAPLAVINGDMQLKNPRNFSGEVRDYRGLREHFVPFPEKNSYWPAVCPNWDNTARQMERAHSWANASPENYALWLQDVVERLRKTRPKGQRIVFINAWNEWGEGCHLEPDEKFGYAWLNATRLALVDEKALVVPSRLRVLVVGHDAARAGAQNLLLTMLREWRKRDDVEFQLILLGDGVLRGHFEKTCRTIVLADYACEETRSEALKKFLEKAAPQVILGNTAVVGPLLKKLKATGAPIATYIHELQKSIERWAPGEVIESTIKFTDHFIAGAGPVAANLSENHGVDRTIISVRESFIKTGKVLPPARLNILRNELGLKASDKVVFGCGTMDWRKGPDLFVKTAHLVLKKIPAARFIWIGPPGTDESARTALTMGNGAGIRFIGERDNIFDYLSLGGVFFLSSREDPFPLVALEAADAGLPIVCFGEAGGMPEFVGTDCGRVVTYEDVCAAAEAIATLLFDEDLSKNLGWAAQAKVRERHDAASGSAAVLDALRSLRDASSLPAIGGSSRDGKHPLVSVIVPNYNHAEFLPERLASIAGQTYRNIEIILLDDKSTDNSLEILRKFAATYPRTRLVENTENSGSTFKQWRKGLLLAQGKYVWIAESDDSAHPELLATLVFRMEANPRATIAACCPQMTDIKGGNLGIPKDWFSDIGGGRWESDFSSSGREILQSVMSEKNAILNASGVLFRNQPKVADLVESSMRLCADWLFWVRLLAQGDFEYSARPLNYWRLASSNARTMPPGAIEWDEGSRILREVSCILGTEGPAERKLLDRFRERCAGWKEKHQKQQWRLPFKR